MNGMSNYVKLAAANRRNGLIFGILMAVAFNLTAWGIDAASLASNAGFLPWLKLLIGGLVSLALGALVGWGVGALDHGASGLIGWGAAGVAVGLVAGHLPYDGYSLVGQWLDPRFQGLDAFPFVESSQSRMTATTVLIAALFALAGIFQPVLLEQARGAASSFARLLALGTAVPAFLLAGVVVDSIVNKPLRSAQSTLHGLIDLVVRERLDIHIGALGPVLDMVSSPQRLMVSSYDAYSLSSVGVEIEFEAGWARCLVIADQATFCQPSDAVFANGFACLLEAEDPLDAGCRIEASEAAARWLTADRERIGPEPALAVQGRLGVVTLMEGMGEGDQAFRCVFRGSLPAVLEACAFGQAPLSGGPFLASPAIDPQD
jgi:hypothetical protein